MRRTVSILTLAGFLAIGAPAISTAAAKAPAKPAPKAPAKPAQVKCPVMGGVVKNTKTAPKSTYKGKTYYFCCAGCKPEFDKNPAKYIKR